MAGSLIKQVSVAAHSAFSRILDEKFFFEGLATLKKLASKLTAADVCLGGDVVKVNGSRSFFSGAKAPASYISIHDNDEFTMGIFVIRSGHRIPLHDHPEMYGLVKVLLGTVSIRSYSALPSGEGHKYKVPKEILLKLSPAQRNLVVPTRCHGTKEVTSNAGTTDDKSVTLVTPEKGNYHEICSVGGGAAFIDILGPPYDQTGRDCTYYSEVGTVYDESLKLDITWLIEIPTPSDFWTDHLPYNGPSVA